MEDVQRTISPVDGTVYVERPFASERDIRTILEAARRATISLLQRRRESRRLTFADA